jgi:hypothetical protein
MPRGRLACPALLAAGEDEGAADDHRDEGEPEDEVEEEGRIGHDSIVGSGAIRHEWRD